METLKANEKDLKPNKCFNIKIEQTYYTKLKTKSKKVLKKVNKSAIINYRNGGIKNE